MAKKPTWREKQATTRQARLPEWLDATVTPETMLISINCDKAWPAFVKKMKAKEYPIVRDQYWWAVFRRCVTTLCKDTLDEPVFIALDGKRHPTIPGGAGLEAGSSEFRKYYKELT